MNKTLSIALAVAMSSPLYALAAPTLYGKANVTYASAKNSAGNTDTSKTELESHASRIGIKGSEAIADSKLEIIYQAEFEIDVDVDDDDSGKKTGQAFTQRNIFVGVKGGFGAVQAGHFDTPLKAAQNKVDLFNDMYGDISKVISKAENRESDSVMYTSPKMAGFTLYGDVISSENDDISNGTSLAATYDNSGFYAALAYDLDVKTEDTSTVRGVVQYTFSDLQLGALVEQYEPVGDADKLNAFFASVKYSMGKWALLGQLGQSDIVENDATTFSLGADYSLSSNAKLFAFYTNNAFTDFETDPVTSVVSDVDFQDDYFGIGMDVKF